MTVTREKGGSYVVHCDECPEVLETETSSKFDAQRLAVDHHGWRTYKGPDDEWAQACPACFELWKKTQRNRGNR